MRGSASRSDMRRNVYVGRCPTPRLGFFFGKKNPKDPKKPKKGKGKRRGDGMSVCATFPKRGLCCKRCAPPHTAPKEKDMCALPRPFTARCAVSGFMPRTNNKLSGRPSIEMPKHCVFLLSQHCRRKMRIFGRCKSALGQKRAGKIEYS